MTPAELAAIKVRRPQQRVCGVPGVWLSVAERDALLALVARQQAVVEIAGQIKARVDAVGPVPSPAFWAEIAALVVRVNALTTYQDGGA